MNDIGICAMVKKNQEVYISATVTLPKGIFILELISKFHKGMQGSGDGRQE